MLQEERFQQLTKNEDDIKKYSIEEDLTEE
jgi:hypothetical protein